MKELFRNSSPGALTRAEAVAQQKEKAAAHRRMAEALARQGRGEDTEIAHVARGELVVPEVLQNPEVLAAVRRAADENGIPLSRLRVGSQSNSINPKTGAAEFGMLDRIRGLLGSSESPSSPAPAMAPDPPINNVYFAPPAVRNLNVSENGPGDIGAAVRDPLGGLLGYRAHRQAKREEKDLFGDNTANAEGDAFRHARASQLLTQSVGPERAKAFGDAHERAVQNPKNERLMDLYNNQVGRTLPYQPDPKVMLEDVRRKGYLRTSPFGE